MKYKDLFLCPLAIHQIRKKVLRHPANYSHSNRAFPNIQQSSHDNNEPVKSTQLKCSNSENNF